MTDIFAMCVKDYAGIEPDYKIGSELYRPDCPQPFDRSLINPLADGGKSFACWSEAIDVTVSSVVVVWLGMGYGGPAIILSRPTDQTAAPSTRL